MTTIQLGNFSNDSSLTLEDLDAVSLAEAAFPVQVSERAVEMVRNAIAETKGEDGSVLRVGVRGGGCSGLQYSLDFNHPEDVASDDWSMECDGVLVVCDGISAQYLVGTDLDYVESAAGAGFKFINPHARRTCGCGSSFAP